MRANKQRLLDKFMPATVIILMRGDMCKMSCCSGRIEFHSAYRKETSQTRFYFNFFRGRYPEVLGASFVFFSDFINFMIFLKYYLFAGILGTVLILG